MRSLSWRLSLMVALLGVALLGKTTPLMAADEDRGGPAERLDRLERRINELAQHQEQLARRLGAAMEGEKPMGSPWRESLRQPGPLPDREGVREPLRPLGREKIRNRMLVEGPAAPVAAKALHDIGGLVELCILGMVAFNILLAIWIFTDIRKRGEGSGIFIALALVAGIPAAIIYALVRIGDKKA